MKTYRFLLVPICFTLFFSCNDFLGCIFPREPELDNRQFPIGSTESYYYVDLNAQIINEPRDEDYDYYFEVEDLPLGLDYFVNFRTISIEGTPEVKGTFDITIFVTVDGPFRLFTDEEPEILCKYSTSKTYTVILE
ncbi:hypothetical protein [Winogradskyella sp. UBA3174]|uniref:hypothetical protein n=1 Tax=Winogradskyella sp. UBA3174 TaxID=1947785 RepID=UPI00260130B0|nr:hypothetical protein [Winogradskyella sp. UBA3174]|tara:strand:- start:9126 stop:9533 length:408 start_codon:yes stop_codon:yes gene_type:complete